MRNDRWTVSAQRLTGLAAVLCLAWGWGAMPAAADAAAGVELIDEQTPWRAYLVQGRLPLKAEEGLRLRERRAAWDFEYGGHDREVVITPVPTRRNPDPEPEVVDLDRRNPHYTVLPPPDWTDADFDDIHWPRYQTDELSDFLGDYGVPAGARGPVALHLRTRFGVSDPERATDLELAATGLGGAVIHVNGQEVGRAYLPEDDPHALAFAHSYPEPAYVDEYGELLPGASGQRPGLGELDLTPIEVPEELRENYEQRIRSFTITIPPDLLHRGANVLAVEWRTAPHRRGGAGWSHLGVHRIALTSDSGDGAIAYREAIASTHLWNAAAEEQITSDRAQQSLVQRRWHWSMYWARGMPVRGTQMGNPFDPLRPLRILVPRGGMGSGQVVISDLDGLHELSATMGELSGRDGAVLKARSVSTRYAAQPDDLHHCDVLMPEPPDGAGTVPIWTIIEAPAGQAPGWYTGTLSVRGNGRSFQVPVQVLVSGATLPPPHEFADVSVHLTQSPRTVAMHYDVEPWSDRHWQLLEPSLKLLGQAGNEVLNVPVILSNFPAAFRPGQPARSESSQTWRQPLIRWVKGDEGRLRPDFEVFDRFLDLYVEHVGPPRAISLWLWEPGSAVELAQAYEGRREHSVETEARTPGVLVQVWDPQTGRAHQHTAPGLLDDDAEAFWRPMLEGVRRRVQQRGWDERIIMLGFGSDVRPGERTGRRVRQWAPYARWDLLSHFSGETPGRKDDGRYIATGGLEVGIRRYPWLRFRRVLSAEQLEGWLNSPPQYVDLPTARWQHQPWSPPFLYRTLPQMWGRLGHLGLDFWRAGRESGPRNSSFFSHVDALTVPGPQGALPTVRFQMLREGVQDTHIRLAIVRACLELAEDQREPYRQLLDELRGRVGHGHGYLSQHELQFDWPGYIARLHEALAELTGQSIDARWDQPPGRE